MMRSLLSCSICLVLVWLVTSSEACQVSSSSIPARAVPNTCYDDASSLGWVTTLRGGGAWSMSSWRPWRWRRSPTVRYRQFLQQQTNVLEKQLRKSQDELQHLRQQFAALKQTSRHEAVAISQRQRQEEERLKELVKTIQHQVNQLEKELAKLVSMNQELETLLKAEQERTKALQAKLDQSKDSSESLRQKYEKELETLRAELEAKAAKQLEELRTMMEQRMEQALENQRKQAQLELQQAVQSARDQERTEANQQLQRQEQLAAQAVEREKVKMRKLVKALAQREKKLPKTSKESTLSSTRTQRVSSSKPKSNKAETVRSRLK